MFNFNYFVYIHSQALEDTEDTLSTNPIPCRYYNAVVFYNEDELGALIVEKGIALWKHEKEKLVHEIKENFVNDALAGDDNENAVIIDDFEEEVDVYVQGSDMLEMFATEPNGILSSSSNAATSKEKVDVSKKPVQESLSKSNAAEPPYLSSAADELLHAKVVWRQTSTSFVLTVQLPDVDEYELKILDDKYSIDFKTLNKSPNYGFKIKLYGRIESKYSVHLTGQYIKFTLTKRLGGVDWPRPLFSKTEKYQWLKGDLLDYAPGNEVDDDDDESLNKIQKLMEQAAMSDDDAVDDDFEGGFNSDDDEDED